MPTLLSEVFIVKVFVPVTLSTSKAFVDVVAIRRGSDIISEANSPPIESKVVVYHSQL